MQSNGKRRICNVERNGWSLDSEASPSPFIHIPYVPLCHCFENNQLFFLALPLPLPKYILLRRDCTRRGFSISNDRGFRSRLLLSRTWARWVVGACKFVITPREVLLLVYPKRIQSFCGSNIIILKLSVIGCLFLSSFQCHRIDRGGKVYCESMLRLYGRNSKIIYTILYTVHQHRYF